MADGVTIPATGSGTATPVVSTDDCGAGGHAQIVKLAVSTNGSATILTADNTDGLLVNPSDRALRDNGIVDIGAALPAGTNNIGDVDILSIAAGNNNIGDVDVASVPAPLSTTGGGTEAAALRVTVASDSTGVLSVDDNGGSLTVDGSVTANAGTNLNTSALALESGGNLAASATSLAILDDWDESDRAKVNPIVGQAGVQGGSGTVSALTQRVVLATDVGLPASTAGIEVVGDVAHDVGVGGNPVLTCGIAQDMDDTAPPNRVSAENDATRLATDRDGALFVHNYGPQIWSYHLNTSTAQTDTTVHASPGAGLSLYVGTIAVSTGAATALNIFFEEGSTTVLGPYYLEAVAGRGFAIQFQPPKKITAATALTVTTSASIAQAIDVTGFVGQG